METPPWLHRCELCVQARIKKLSLPLSLSSAPHLCQNLCAQLPKLHPGRGRGQMPGAKATQSCCRLCCVPGQKARARPSRCHGRDTLCLPKNLDKNRALKHLPVLAVETKLPELLCPLGAQRSHCIHGGDSMGSELCRAGPSPLC